jgi:signal transduction histidine kinase
VHTDLSNFFKIQEERLKGLPVFKNNNVKINCNDALDINNLAQTYLEEFFEYIKNFTVKTLKVNWEGYMNSFMYLFIDISDIILLEQAKEDIRCKKVMFASLSHELRIPLNAILNSYKARIL